MSLNAIRKARQKASQARAPKRLKKKKNKKKGQKLTKRQKFALEFPYHSLRGDSLQMEHRRQVGLFETLLTVDLFPDFEDMAGNHPEWHASVTIIIGKMPSGPHRGMPLNPPLHGWGPDVWERCILECKTLLRGVGEGGGYWTGETCSLHFRKPLTAKELDEVPSQFLTKKN